MKKTKTNKPLDVFESEKAQAQVLVDEAFGSTLEGINQYQQSKGLETVSIQPEVNEKKRKVTSLYRIFLGKESDYCGNFHQVASMINQASQVVARAKAEEIRQQEEQQEPTEKVEEVESVAEPESGS